jgi:hypothetical protein
VSATAGTLAFLLVLWSMPALGQGVASRPAHRMEVSVGGLFLGGAGLGSETAELRANRTPPAPFTLFTTDTRIVGVPGFDGRVGFWLTPSVVVEGGFVYAHPRIRTHVSGDIEGGEAIDLDDRLDQYFFDASGSLMLDRWTFLGFVPFVEGGGGYLRQLHEGRTLVETGQVYHAGGGLRRWLRTRDSGFIRGLGLRVDGRAYVLRNGFSLDESPRSHGAISGAVVVLF